MKDSIIESVTFESLKILEEILKQHFKFALGINCHNNNEENKKLFFLSSVDGTLPLKSNNAPPPPPQHCEICNVISNNDFCDVISYVDHYGMAAL